MFQTKNSYNYLNISEDYYPYGMLMPGRHEEATESVYRYAFNGMQADKEIKGERNNYDFGARMYDPRVGRWLTRDPLEAKYTGLSPYNFVANTPLMAKDPDGRWIIFVNGYYNTGNTNSGNGGYAIIKKLVAKNEIGTVGGEGYWKKKFVGGAQNYFSDPKQPKFVDGSGAWNSTGQERYDAGYTYAKNNFSDIKKEIFNDDGVQTEVLRIVSHSMGAAYSEGMIKYLEEQGVKVETVVHLSAADPSEFTASTKPNTIQLNYKDDPVLMYKNFGEAPRIKGADVFGEVDAEGQHWITKSRESVWDAVADLQNLQLKLDPERTVTYGNRYVDTYESKGNTKGTQFTTVTKPATKVEVTNTGTKIKTEPTTYTKTGTDTYSNSRPRF